MARKKVEKAEGSAFQPNNKYPIMDGSGDTPPAMSADMNFRDVGSYGLRQFSGYLRDEFLRALQGREAARTYREMRDNSPTVGAVLFAITQLIRKVEWRIKPADESAEAEEKADFVRSLMDDMSETWEDFIVEALSMLPFGYSIHEIVYKKREGRKGTPPSKNDDGHIGIHRLPMRGQETVIKWFFDNNGQIKGVRQQPWVGPLIDLPIEKLLIFRPSQYKNNPEGYSILRTAYRPYYFQKRLEEQEAILFERFSGFPVLSVPSALLSAANAGNEDAAAAVEAYKKIITNVRIDEQMGLLKPSDHYIDADGKISAAEMYKFEFATPQAGRSTNTLGESINRYKLDIAISVLADFLFTGHSAGSSGRSAQALGISKVDIFYQATEGWLKSIAAVLNTHLLPRLWRLNDFDDDLMPEFSPDMAQRVDLDALGNFVLHLAQSGMMMFPDKDLENYIRDASGLPNITDEAWEAKQAAQAAALMGAPPNGEGQIPGREGSPVSEAPAGQRSISPTGKNPNIHQPGTVSSSGVGVSPQGQNALDAPSSPESIKKVLLAKAARAVISNRNRII